MKRKIFTKKTFQILGAGILLLCGVFLFMKNSVAWTDSTLISSESIIFAPLSSSSIGQSKWGGLLLNLGNATHGLIVRYGKVGIGTDTPQSELDVAGKIMSTGLEISSTVAGILFPRLSTVERDFITNPTESTLIYNTTDKKFNFFADNQWKIVGSGSSSGQGKIVTESAVGDGRTGDYYCKRKNITAEGQQKDWILTNEGKLCGENDKICQSGECKELSCTLDFYKTGLVCSAVGAGYYSPIADNSRYACTNKPANSIYTGSGGGANNCPWICNSGYVQSGSSCIVLPAKVVTTIDSGYGPKITIGADGLPNIGYIKEKNLIFTHCIDPDCVNKSVSVIASSASHITSFVIAPDGFARITYFTIVGAGRNIKLVRCQDVNCSNKTITNVSSGDMTGGTASLSFKANGLPMISYSDNPYEFQASYMKFASCLDADCVNKNLKHIDSSGYGFSNATMPDGLPIVAYFSGKPGTSWAPTYPNLKIIKCADTNCSSFSSSLVDSISCYTEELSLLLGPDSLPRILYNDVLGPKFVRCSDALCSTKNITVIDSQNNKGQYLSMALGPDGMARMSYFFAPSEDLKFVRCNNADCTSKNVSTLDSLGRVGVAPSMAIGKDGLSRIVYGDGTNSKIKFIRCNKDNCSD